MVHSWLLERRYLERLNTHTHTHTHTQRIRATLHPRPPHTVSIHCAVHQLNQYYILDAHTQTHTHPSTLTQTRRTNHRTHRYEPKHTNAQTHAHPHPPKPKTTLAHEYTYTHKHTGRILSWFNERIHSIDVEGTYILLYSVCQTLLLVIVLVRSVSVVCPYIQTSVVCYVYVCCVFCCCDACMYAVYMYIYMGVLVLPDAVSK